MRDGQNPLSPLSIAPRMRALATLAVGALLFAIPLATHVARASEEEKPVERTYTATPAAPAFQSWDDAKPKSAGCVSCHTASDRKTMHASEAVVLGCTDCHGGNASVFAPNGERYSADDKGHARNWSSGYTSAMEQAHVLPLYPDKWKTSANPERSYTWLLKESLEFVRFVNPGDLRVANEACGACHLPINKASWPLL